MQNQQPARWLSGLVLAFSVSASLLVAYGCGKRGPAEKAGEKVDNAVDNTKDVFDKDGPAEKAGEKVDKALDDKK